MNDISDGAIVLALGKQMTLSVARQLVAAGNLANVDTPGYRTRDASFGEALDRELSMPLATPTSGQQTAPQGSAPAESEVDGLPSRRDGNNVQLDRELMNMSRASGDFAAAQAALSAKFRLVRYAINEGR